MAGWFSNAMSSVLGGLNKANKAAQVAKNIQNTANQWTSNWGGGGGGGSSSSSSSGGGSSWFSAAADNTAKKLAEEAAKAAEAKRIAEETARRIQQDVTRQAVTYDPNAYSMYNNGGGSPWGMVSALDTGTPPPLSVINNDIAQSKNKGLLNASMAPDSKLFGGLLTSPAATFGLLNSEPTSTLISENKKLEKRKSAEKVKNDINKVLDMANYPLANQYVDPVTGELSQQNNGGIGVYLNPRIAEDNKNFTDYEMSGLGGVAIKNPLAWLSPQEATKWAQNSVTKGSQASRSGVKTDRGKQLILDTYNAIYHPDQEQNDSVVIDKSKPQGIINFAGLNSVLANGSEDLQTRANSYDYGLDRDLGKRRSDIGKEYTNAAINSLMNAANPFTAIRQFEMNGLSNPYDVNNLPVDVKEDYDTNYTKASSVANRKDKNGKNFTIGDPLLDVAMNLAQEETEYNESHDDEGRRLIETNAAPMDMDQGERYVYYLENTPGGQKYKQQLIDYLGDLYLDGVPMTDVLDGISMEDLLNGKVGIGYTNWRALAPLVGDFGWADMSDRIWRDIMIDYPGELKRDPKTGKLDAASVQAIDDWATDPSHWFDVDEAIANPNSNYWNNFARSFSGAQSGFDWLRRYGGFDPSEYWLGENYQNLLASSWPEYGSFANKWRDENGNLTQFATDAMALNYLTSMAQKEGLDYTKDNKTDAPIMLDALNAGFEKTNQNGIFGKGDGFVGIDKLTDVQPRNIATYNPVIPDDYSAYATWNGLISDPRREILDMLPEEYGYGGDYIVDKDNNIVGKTSDMKTPPPSVSLPGYSYSPVVPMSPYYSTSEEAAESGEAKDKKNEYYINPYAW